MKLPENKLHSHIPHYILPPFSLHVRTDAVVALEPKRNCLAPASRAPRGHSTTTTFSTTTTTLASSSSLSFLPWHDSSELGKQIPFHSRQCVDGPLSGSFDSSGYFFKSHRFIHCGGVGDAFAQKIQSHTMSIVIATQIKGTLQTISSHKQGQLIRLPYTSEEYKNGRQLFSWMCVYLWESSALSSSLAFCSVWKLPIE